jgi:NAD(P) transhydrogenase subunit alpha
VRVLVSVVSEQFLARARRWPAPPARRKPFRSLESMSETLVALYVFVLACFIGYWVVWGVTPALHTPLVALTNAISGIVIVGALLVAGLKEAGVVADAMGFIAVLLASINVFGGFLVTHRMLSMFKKRSK